MAAYRRVYDSRDGDSGSPLATGTHDERSRHGFSDFSRLWRAVLVPPTPAVL